MTIILVSSIVSQYHYEANQKYQEGVGQTSRRLDPKVNSLKLDIFQLAPEMTVFFLRAVQKEERSGEGGRKVTGHTFSPLPPPPSPPPCTPHTLPNANTTLLETPNYFRTARRALHKAVGALHTNPEAAGADDRRAE